MRSILKTFSEITNHIVFGPINRVVYSVSFFLLAYLLRPIIFYVICVRFGPFRHSGYANNFFKTNRCCHFVKEINFQNKYRTRSD
jgi:hypothetical protein